MLPAMFLRTLSTLALCAAAACGGGDPVDASGDYTVSLTNRENGCGFANWTVGATTTGVALLVTQTGAQASADVQDVGARLVLDGFLGGHVFTGTVSGSNLDLGITGTRALSQGACAYTIDAVIDANLNGDLLTGDLLYMAKTNLSVDCGALTNCTSRVEFNGTRPPS